MGLWLAESMRPPAAWWCSTASWMLGVVVRPTSMTRAPTACRALIATRWNIGPETRLSRPSTTAPRPPALATAQAPKPCAKRATISGDSASPTRPRTPETLTINPS